ncbi:M1 family metallopeptidase [Xanthocytophaga agilis]|uniref:M1 family metallopeptidase n=1 Tax=Xanthocytophaga agilis TaxID=3048010 RepID=A0AAE3RAR6_9BACT|nr:M1 family metallopeptidase [Xanthocytophaga agilis]MDJ1506819.1 M1 family metallopeptidase [Xanthocytophaga agilis]
MFTDQKRFLLLYFFFLSNLLFAQQVSLPIATNLTKAYTTHTRSLNGSPSKSYWQNKVDYTIQLTFDPLTRQLAGDMTISYQNNSPDTLTQLVFKLFPNLYKAGAMRSTSLQANDLTDGVEIKSLLLEGQSIASKNQVIRGTNMYIRGTEIHPGQLIQIKVSFAYVVNKTSFVRTGQVDSGAFVIAYFFPRIAVYDDLDGWDQYPYTGKEEFYNDFCNFQVTIALPGNYQCWATGTLRNPQEVYQPIIQQRIEAALHGDGITDIITTEDLTKEAVTQKKSVNTWRFEAKDVSDFAFTVSNHYIWKASGITVDTLTHRRTRVDVVYNPEHKAFEPVIDYARKTVELISYSLPGIPFPYATQCIFEGLDAMEYPMMVNNLPFEADEAIYFTVHEIFHSLFPFVVGSNETKHSFMDEGWATWSEFTLAPMIKPSLADMYDISPFTSSAGSDQDVPIMTLTPQLYGKARYSDKDLKPALGLHYVREMLGDSLFLKALRYYIQQWQGKHPTPYDFFYCFNAGSGKNLNWFWKNWFFEKFTPDLAIEQVVRKRNQYKVVILNKGGCMLPVHLTVLFTDGTKQEVSSSIASWSDGKDRQTLTFKSIKVIQKLVLGKPYDADSNLSDNIWEPAKH